MNNSRSENREDGDSLGGGRFFEEASIIGADLQRGRMIPRDGCPRRYCWWWVSLSFEWHLTPTEGCKFLKSKKPPGFRYGDIPCCRSEPSSPIDHFEPREPHLEKDNIDPTRWLEYRAEKNAGARENLKGQGE